MYVDLEVMDRFEELECIISNASSIPFSHKSGIDKEEVLELINSSKKNERERDTDDNRNNINQAFSEVYDIVNHIEKDLYNKIPKNFIAMLEKNKDEKYVPQIDYSKSINEQKLLKDTRVILSLIYRDYICTNEEREEIDERDREEMRKKERKAQIKYSYDNLFKKKNKAEKANSINEEINTKVVEYKENIWSRMIKFIKKLWHRN